MKDVIDYNLFSVNPYQTDLATKKILVTLTKSLYSINVKTYEDAIKNLNKIDIDTIQKHNTFLKLTVKQEDSLRLLQEMIYNSPYGNMDYFFLIFSFFYDIIN